ncbi:hypothetical protein Acr_26g0000050 [Actinidia rufa]|uniref:Reverse transcriptase domain-containing protein n=1 Tax=Actinidia rufa TaxID=165716 RepID=A0A7J0H141_9ERIC|nr:hypothetical protein Acr_26g0000050 [Actinidia rufa]
MGELKSNPDFNFHPRCGGLKITHLAYADDLILLSIGDPTSVSLIMEKLNHLGDCSGLKISLSKSSLFLAGISSTDLEAIKGITGFNQGSFPFKYLGILVAASKLSIAQFSPLIDKILNYISAWVGVRTKITQLCRNFLWSGKGTGRKPDMRYNQKLARPSIYSPGMPRVFCQFDFVLMLLKMGSVARYGPILKNSLATSAVVVRPSWFWTSTRTSVLISVEDSLSFHLVMV